MDSMAYTLVRSLASSKKFVCESRQYKNLIHLTDLKARG